MIVITKNAEEKLLQGLSDHEPSSTAQRCFYLSLSRSDLPKMNIFESFLNLLQDMPDSYLAQIYICHDHDVFILMNGFMQRQFFPACRNAGRSPSKSGAHKTCEHYGFEQGPAKTRAHVSSENRSD